MIEEKPLESVSNDLAPTTNKITTGNMMPSSILMVEDRPMESVFGPKDQRNHCSQHGVTICSKESTQHGVIIFSGGHSNHGIIYSNN